MKTNKWITKISPLWLGISISGGLLLILLVNETVQGRWAGLMVDGEFDALATVSDGILRDLRLAIVHCLIAGYLPAAILHVIRTGQRTVYHLQGALSCTDEECDSLAASVKLNLRSVTLFGLVALVFSYFSPYLTPPVPEQLWNPSTWNAEVMWHRILGPVTIVFSFWLGYAIISVSLRMSRIAMKLNQIDLFDLAPLNPFSQQGLTGALLFIGSFSIWSLMMIESGFGQMFTIIGLLTLTTSLIAFIAPVYGVHKRIRQFKEEELSWVNEQITYRRKLFKSPEHTKQSGEMADLVTYRGLVNSLSEWPFTTSNYMRFVLYAFLPLITWGIGLVAENLINSLLY